MHIHIGIGINWGSLFSTGLCRAVLWLRMMARRSFAEAFKVPRKCLRLRVQECLCAHEEEDHGCLDCAASTWILV